MLNEEALAKIGQKYGDIDFVEFDGSEKGGTMSHEETIDDREETKDNETLKLDSKIDNYMVNENEGEEDEDEEDEDERYSTKGFEFMEIRGIQGKLLYDALS